MKQQSKLLTLDRIDFIKGAIMFGIVGGLTSLIDVLSSNQLPTIEQLETAGKIALTAFIAYLIKNLLTNSEGKLIKKEPVVIVDPVSESSAK